MHASSDWLHHIHAADLTWLCWERDIRSHSQNSAGIHHLNSSHKTEELMDSRDFLALSQLFFLKTPTANTAFVIYYLLPQIIGHFDFCSNTRFLCHIPHYLKPKISLRTSLLPFHLLSIILSTLTLSLLHCSTTPTSFFFLFSPSPCSSGAGHVTEGPQHYSCHSTTVNAASEHADHTES